MVERVNAGLYGLLKRSFAGMSRVKVIVDRRISDRRAVAGQAPDERRYVRTRRVREGTPLGNFTIVRFTPKERLLILKPS